VSVAGPQGPFHNLIFDACGWFRTGTAITDFVVRPSASLSAVAIKFSTAGTATKSHVFQPHGPPDSIAVGYRYPLFGYPVNQELSRVTVLTL
jgi:hypothetical protein